MNKFKTNILPGLTRISADQEKRTWEFSYDAINVSAMKLNKINLLLSVRISVICVYQW
jgi:hypothetical protein